MLFLKVPFELYVGSQFTANLQFSGIVAEKKTTTLEVTRPKPAIFVQTDKGIYKPGDLGK